MLVLLVCFHHISAAMSVQLILSKTEKLELHAFFHMETQNQFICSIILTAGMQLSFHTPFHLTWDGDYFSRECTVFIACRSELKEIHRERLWSINIASWKDIHCWNPQAIMCFPSLESMWFSTLLHNWVVHCLGTILMAKGSLDHLLHI